MRGRLCGRFTRAFDRHENIERQVKQTWVKVRLKVQDISFDIDPDLLRLSVKDCDTREIVKTKKFGDVTPAEATMQMDLLVTTSFIFKNDLDRRHQCGLPPRNGRLWSS